MKGPSGIGETSYLLADASAINQGWSGTVKRSNLLPDAQGRNDGQWHQVDLAGGGSIQVRFARWKGNAPVFEAKGQSATIMKLEGFQSFSAAASTAAERTRGGALKAIGSNSAGTAPAANPFQGIANIKVGNQSLGQLTQRGMNAAGQLLQNTPLPLVGVTPKQAVSAYNNAVVPVVNQASSAVGGKPVLSKLPEPVALQTYRGKVYGGTVTAEPLPLSADGRQRWRVQWEGKQGITSLEVQLKGQFGSRHLANGSFTKNSIGEFVKATNQHWAQIERQQQQAQKLQTQTQPQTQPLTPGKPTSPEQQKVWAGQALQQVSALPAPESKPVQLNALDPRLGLAKGVPKDWFSKGVNGLASGVGNLVGDALGLPQDSPQQKLFAQNRASVALYDLTKANVAVDEQGRFTLPNTQEAGQFYAALVAQSGQAGDPTGSGFGNVQKVGLALDKGLAQQYGLSKEFMQGYKKAQDQMAVSGLIAAAQTLSSLAPMMATRLAANRLPNPNPGPRVDVVAGARTEVKPNARPIEIKPLQQPVVNNTRPVQKRLTPNVEVNGNRPPPKLPQQNNPPQRVKLPDANTIDITPISSEVVKSPRALRSKEMNTAIPNPLSTPINRQAVLPNLPAQNQLRGNGKTAPQLGSNNRLPPSPGGGGNNTPAVVNAKTPRNNAVQTTVPVNNSGNESIKVNNTNASNAPVLGQTPRVDKTPAQPTVQTNSIAQNPWGLSLGREGDYRIQPPIVPTQPQPVSQAIAQPPEITQTVNANNATNDYENITAALSTFREKLERVKKIDDLDLIISRTESIGNTGLLKQKRFDTSPSFGFTPQDRRLLDQTLRNPKTREQFISGQGLSQPLLTLRARLQQQLLDPAVVQRVYPQGLPRGLLVQDDRPIKTPGNRDQASLPGSVSRQEKLVNFKTGAESILDYDHFPLVQHPTLPGQTTNTAGSQATEHYLRAAYQNMPLWSDFANRPFGEPTQQHPISFRRQGQHDKQFEAWFQISESNAAGSTGKVATAAVSIPPKPRKGENTLEQAWAGEIPLSEANKPKPRHDKFYLSKVGAGGLPGGGNRIMDFAENTLRDEYGAPYIWGHAYQGRPNSRSVYSPLSNGANDAADVTLVDKRFDSPVLKLEGAERRLSQGADALSRALDLVTGNVPPSPQALKTALQDAAVGVQGGINMMDAAPRKPRATRDSLLQLLGQIQARIPSGDVTAPLDITEWRGFLQDAQQQLAKASKEVRAAIGQEGERFGVDQRPTPDELERLRTTPDPDGFYTRRGYTAQLTGINPQSGAAGFHIHKWLNEGVPAAEPPLSWGQVLDDVKVGMQKLPSDLQQAAKDTVQAPVNWVKDRINDTRRDWEIFKTVTAPAAPGEQSLSPLQMGWEIARDAALQYGKKIQGPDLSGTYKPPVGIQPDPVGPQLVNPIVTGIRYSFDASAKVAQWTFKNVVPWLAYISANAALMGDFKIIPNDRSSRRIFNVEPEAQTITVKGGDQLGLPFNILLGQNPGYQPIIKTPIGKEGNVATPYAVSIPATGTVGAYSGFVAVPPSPLPGLLPSRIFGGVEWGRADIGLGAGAGFSINPLGTLRANPLAVTNTPNVGTALRSSAVLTLPNAQGSYWVDVGPVRVVGGRFITNAWPFLDASTQPGNWEFNNRFGVLNLGAGRSTGGWNMMPTGSMLTINTGYDAEAAQIFWTEKMRELMEFLNDSTKPFSTGPAVPQPEKDQKK